MVFQIWTFWKDQWLLASALNGLALNMSVLCDPCWRVLIAFVQLIFFCVVWIGLLCCIIIDETKIIYLRNRLMELDSNSFPAHSHIRPLPPLTLCEICTCTEPPRKVMRSSSQPWCPMVDSGRLNSLCRHWSILSFISGDQLLIYMSEGLMLDKRLTLNDFITFVQKSPPIMLTHYAGL